MVMTSSVVAEDQEGERGPLTKRPEISCCETYRQTGEQTKQKRSAFSPLLLCPFTLWLSVLWLRKRRHIPENNGINQEKRKIEGNCSQSVSENP